MHKLLFAIIILSFIAATAAVAETIKGPCKLVYDERGRTVSERIEVGSVVKGKCEFKLMEFAGTTAITANGVFVNTGDKAMRFAYYVSFFDKEGDLVGSTGFYYWGEERALDAGKSSRPASCIIRIPDTARDKVASYQVAFHEEETSTDSEE